MKRIKDNKKGIGVRFRRFVGFMFFLCFVGSSSSAQTVDQAGLDAILNEAMTYWRTPGAAMVVVKGDDAVYLKGIGVRNVKTKEPVTPETIFAIGSTTKAFTTAAMAILVDQGLMKWDDPVRKHLPAFRLSDPLANESVTLRDLVTHRTGLIRHDMLWYNAPWGREEILRRIGLVPLTYPFRTTFQYQNIMFLAAGEAVAATAGLSYEDFVRKRIFQPLGMKTASFTTVEAERAANHSTPHERRGEKAEPISWRSLNNISPAGSINASVSDLASWIRMQLNEGSLGGKRLLSADSVREMHTPQQVIRLEGRWKIFFPETDTLQLSYGLGWFINDYRGHQLVMHGGTIDGFRAAIVLVPAAKLGVAVLTNLNGTQMPEATCYNVMDLLLGNSKKDWNRYLDQAAKNFEREGVEAIDRRLAARKPDAKASHELAAYCGTYEDAAYGKADVSLIDGGLTLAWSNFKTRLEHFHYDTFNALDERLQYEPAMFSLNRDGDVAGMQFLGAKFKKIKP
jgi:CubicO group peptidase (beta-lactamase class C family)